VEPRLTDILMPNSAMSQKVQDYLSGEGLKGLERRSMTVSELADELASSCDIPRDSKLQQYVEQMLASFSDLGLTRPTRS
jgi:hypothetical protein